MSGVVNICFHGIGTPRRELEPGEARYWITADQYARVLDEVITWPTPVVFSFDDGNVSDVAIGLPGLLERGLTATFFVLAGRLDQPGSLGKADVRSLAAHGMPVGSHGMRHQPWRGLDQREREAEFVTARDQLARAVGAPVNEAALPLGRYDRRVLSELRHLGYRRIYTSDRRKARADAWLQPRFSVTGADTPETLRAEALNGHGTIADAKLTAKGWVKRLR